MANRYACDTLSWDWREQPDLDELTRILARHNVHLHQVDTGSDQYAVVIAGTKLTAKQANDHYQTSVEGK